MDVGLGIGRPLIVMGVPSTTHSCGSSSPEILPPSGMPISAASVRYTYPRTVLNSEIYAAKTLPRRRTATDAECVVGASAKCLVCVARRPCTPMCTSLAHLHRRRCLPMVDRPSRHTVDASSHLCRQHHLLQPACYCLLPIESLGHLQQLLPSGR